MRAFLDNVYYALSEYFVETEPEFPLEEMHKISHKNVNYPNAVITIEFKTGEKFELRVKEVE